MHNYQRDERHRRAPPPTPTPARLNRCKLNGDKLFIIRARRITTITTIVTHTRILLLYSALRSANLFKCKKYCLHPRSPFLFCFSASSCTKDKRRRIIVAVVYYMVFGVFFQNFFSFQQGSREHRRRASPPSRYY